MTLHSPYLLLLALLVPVVFWWRSRGRKGSVEFAPGGFLRRGGGPPIPATWRVRLRGLPEVLAAGGLLLLVVALARPMRRVPIPRSSEGIDILLCLDTSSSMAANDLDPESTRLAVARTAARRFIAGRPDDRIGLIRFARYPDVACPLTLDHEALVEFLSDADLVEGDGPEDATGIGAAVARAAQVLASSGESRVVILLTDGAENVAAKDKPAEIAPLHAGQLCEQVGVRVYVISVGLGGRSSEGEWTPVDTRQVRTLAERTGGRFYTARDAGAVDAVYEAIDVLEKAEFQETRYRLAEAHLPFLGAALLLLLLGSFLEYSVFVVLP